MIELIMCAAAVILMIRIAGMENQSEWAWGFITFALCALSLLIPWPLLRIAIAAVVAFLTMTVYKIIADK